MRRDDVDWEKASCRGLDTDIFYMHEAELLEQEGIDFMTLRRLCFRCPIWKECLTIGFKYERYGFWGGVSADERDHMVQGIISRKHSKLLTQLKELGLDYEEIYRISKVERQLIW